MGAEQLTMTRRPVEVAPGFPESGPQLGVFDNGLATLDVPSRQSAELLVDSEQLLADIDEIAPKPTTYFLGNVAVRDAGVVLIDSLPGEEKTRERYDQFLGGVALYLSQRKELNPPEVDHRSSLDILRDEDRVALLLDARTHVAEIDGGVGEGIGIELPVNANGETIWAGQTTEGRQFHTLTAYSDMAPPILEAVHAEGLGGFRIADRKHEGQLEGKIVFDFSAIPDGSPEDLSDWGYYLDPMACSMRSHQFEGNIYRGKSVSVAGVDERQLPPRVKGETEAQEAARKACAVDLRIDVRVLRRMLGLLGVENADRMTQPEMLEKQVVLPDSFDLIDMTMLYDVLAAEEVTGNDKTFFGSVKLWQELGSPAELTREHYERHSEQREERQAQRGTLYEKIVDEQIRRKHEAATPREAAELKREITLGLVVERAGHDASFDAERLGGAAADKIYAAREQFALGDSAGGDKLINEAKKEARDPSCPIKDQKDPLNPDGNDVNKSEERGACKEVKNGDKVKCPHCRQIVLARVPKKGGAIYCTNKDCVAFKEV